MAKAWLTQKRLEALVENYTRKNYRTSEGLDDYMTEAFRRIYRTMAQERFEYIPLENGDIGIESLGSGWAETRDDELACMFQWWGCTVDGLQDWETGDVDWTISLPESREQERENKRKWKEVWD